jgi:hypothetical protein
MKKFEEVEYIQLLLHPTERKMAIRPCRKNDTHSIKWRPDLTKALISKTISCPHFSNALYQIMDWNPDNAYRVRGTWAKRGVDEIIVFPLTNSEPAAYMEVVNPETEQVRKRRTTLCPEEWNDSFGEEFYDYALENSFYYLAPRTDWNSQAKSIIAPGVKQVAVLSEEELQASIEQLKEKVE